MPPPLRIAHVVNEPFGHESASGVQQVIHCLTHAQAEIGQSVAVFSRESAGVRFLGASAAGAPSARRTARTTSPTRTLHAQIVSRYLEAHLAGEVVDWQPDVVHFHSIHIPQNVALGAELQRAGIPYCVTVHGGLFPAALRRGRLKKLAFNRLFERGYLNTAAFVHAVSPHEVDVIRHYGVEGPIVVVPNGVPPGAGEPPTRPDALVEEHPTLRNRLVCLFVGRLDVWQKGLDLLIEGLAASGLRDVALVLVGPDWRGSRERLAALGTRLGIGSRLVFTGPAFGAARANLFAGADLFVHPSRWEGLSLSVLAAAAAGKACLLTRDADPLGELARAGAALIVEPSVPAIAAGLRRAAVLGRHELHAMGTRARQVAESQFTWTSVADQLVRAYRQAGHRGSSDAGETVPARRAVRTG